MITAVLTRWSALAAALLLWTLGHSPSSAQDSNNGGRLTLPNLIVPRLDLPIITGRSGGPISVQLPDLNLPNVLIMLPFYRECGVPNMLQTI
jgi:hypothetical protein